MSLSDEIKDVILLDHLDIEIDLERSTGNLIWDTKREKFILDCFSYIASNPIGHNHLAMSEVAFEQKLLKAAKNNPSNSDVLTKEYVDFVKDFTTLAMPKEFKKVFFVAGGTLAVENALKTAFDWKLRKLHSRDVLGIVAEDLEIVHFTRAFHGRSGYSLSLTNTDPSKFKYFPKFNWARFEPELETDSIDVRDQKFLDLECYIKSHRNRIAAIIIEPIQGEGGDRHFPKDFHQGLRRLADENECLLIYDEVQTGMGLTGKLWAYQNYEIVPDVISFGKKCQVCGIMVGDRVLSVPGNVFEEKSRINSTWGGNLVDMVRFQKYLEVIYRDNLVENAKTVGAYLLKSLKALEGRKFNKKVTNARGKGLMCSFDLPTTALRNQFVSRMLENGVLLLGCGERSIRFRPSLTFTKEEVDGLIKTIRKVLQELL